jgi:hypothetical protein
VVELVSPESLSGVRSGSPAETNQAPDFPSRLRDSVTAQLTEKDLMLRIRSLDEQFGPIASLCQEFSLIQHIETFYERIEAIEFNMGVTDWQFR